MLETNCRNFAYAEELQSLGASMTCNQTQVAIDQKGNIETEIMDTTSDLLNLLLGVEARVFGIRFELFKVSINDRERGVHVLVPSNVVARPCAHRCHGKISSDLSGCEGTHGLVAPIEDWQRCRLPVSVRWHRRGSCHHRGRFHGDTCF